MQISRIKPNSERTILSKEGLIRILNRAGVSVPARRMAQVLDLAGEAHRFARTGSAQPFPRSVFGRCHVAAIYFCDKADRLDGIKGADILRGVEVPGSGGHAANLQGLHHLNLLSFNDMLLAVDVTIAQLWQYRHQFKNTAVQVIVSPPSQLELRELMIRVYGGGDWFVSPLWF